MAENSTEIGNDMANKIRKIVLTGAAGSGKSTSMVYVKDQADWIEFVPEVATILLSGGFPTPDDRHSWNIEWQKSFQVAVAHTQIALEKIAEARAKAGGKRVILFDRGLLDGASFLAGGVGDLVRITKLSEQAMLDRYDTVIHLSSLALNDNEFNTSNPHRVEDLGRAKHLEDKTLAAWENHPNRHIVTDSSRHRGEIVLEIIKAELDKAS